MHIHNLEKWYRWIYFQGRDRDANIEKTYGHRRKGRVGQTGRLGLTNIYYHFSSDHVWVWESDHKEGWAPKSWCFWAVVLEKTLERVPWAARRLNQSILKKIHPAYSLEGLTLKLKLQYFGHLMRRADSLEKTQRLGKIEGRRRKGRQRTRWLNGITDSMDMKFTHMSVSKLWETVKDRGGAWHAAVYGVAKSWTWLSGWTTANV